MTTTPVHRPTAPPSPVPGAPPSAPDAVPGAPPSAPDARRFEVRRKDGPITYLPLTDLAEAWAMDYRSLRDFVRDHSGVHSEKLTLPDPDHPGQNTTLIVIEADALGVLYYAVRPSPSQA